MPKATASPSWAKCKQILSGWPPECLPALIHDLYDLSDENRRFLHARLLPQGSSVARGEAEAAMSKLLSPSAAFNGRFKHSALKKIVDQFEKSTDDAVALAELLMFDLDRSSATLSEVGDDVNIVDHLYATAKRLHETLPHVDPAELEPLVMMLDKIASRWSRSFGYGISDEMVAVAGIWKDRLAGKK